MIELIVVMAIVLVLVSFSSVRYFRMVEKSRASEAVEVLTRIFRGYKIRQIDEELTTGIGWA